jgi:hypothetical protein
MTAIADIGTKPINMDRMNCDIKPPAANTDNCIAKYNVV